MIAQYNIHSRELEQVRAKPSQGLYRSVCYGGGGAVNGQNLFYDFSELMTRYS